MKSILVEDILDLSSSQEQVVFKLEDGVEVQGWAVAKPLNYKREFVDDATREAWIEEIRDGRAVAVHFTCDEIEAGEVPTLYTRHLEKQKALELARREFNGGEEIHQESSTSESSSE